jgi:ectoine hydroxylase-related dioxygenase (phytanoyl-CoA dioxygenase family)
MKSKIRLTAPNSQPSLEQVEHAANQFQRYGCLWIENAFEKSTIAKLRDAYQKNYLSLTKAQLRQRDASVGDQRFMITVDIKGRFNQPEVYANNALMPILQTLLSDSMRIASFGSVVALPGADDQAIHLDHPPLFGTAIDSHTADAIPPYALTMVIPLVNLNADTGTTAIWEGSHRGPERFERLKTLMQTPDFGDASLPMAVQGDAYLMDYRVIHGGTANTGDHARPVLYIVYSRRWFRDGFNFQTQHPVSISKKQLKKMPKNFRMLFDGT